MVDRLRHHSPSWKVLIGGSGGQGVLTMGKILACAGIERRLNVSFLPSYGAEMRGGYVYSMLSFSFSELASPVISFADCGVFLDESSLRMLRDRVKRTGWCLWNSSLIEPHENNCSSNLAIPASEMAETIGDVRVANSVMTGALLVVLNSIKFPVTMDDLLVGIRETIHDRKQQSLNWRAVLQGKKLAEKALNNG
jgi:2-oxoglutarate ferredoxin oxidoreductase subunit gamma